MNRPCTLILALLLPACGAEVVTSAPVTPTPVTPAPVAPAPVTPAPEVLAVCTPPRADGAVLTLVAGADVLALDASGAVRTLDAGDAAAPRVFVTAVVASADGYLALSRQRRVSASEVENTYALHAPDGSVRWRRSQTVRYGGSPTRVSTGLQQLFVSPGGEVVANHTSFDTMQRASVEGISPDGTSRWLTGASAVGPADASGRVLVESRPNSGAELRWWSPRGGAVEALGASDVPGGAMVIGGYALTWESGPAGLSLVSRRGARVDRLALPFASIDALYFDHMREEGWGLMHGRDASDVVYRVDLGRARLEPITVRHPAGLRPVGDFARPGIDSDGALLAFLRDGEWGGLYRSIDGDRWSPVGRPVMGTLTVETSERAGTYVIRAHNDRYGGEEWPEEVRAEPDGLRGPSLHIVRPATGRDVVVYSADPERSFGGDLEVALAPSGRCAAWVDSADGASVVHVADLVDGTRHRAPLPRGLVGGRPLWF